MAVRRDAQRDAAGNRVLGVDLAAAAELLARVAVDAAVRELDGVVRRDLLLGRLAAGACALDGGGGVFAGLGVGDMRGLARHRVESRALARQRPRRRARAEAEVGRAIALASTAAQRAHPACVDLDGEHRVVVAADARRELHGRQLGAVLGASHHRGDAELDALAVADGVLLGFFALQAGGLTGDFARPICCRCLCRRLCRWLRRWL